MKEEISVRQWQEKFRAGAFDHKDIYTQCKAGWYDWFCQDHALSGRLKKIARRPAQDKALQEKGGRQGVPGGAHCPDDGRAARAGAKY
ncbi:hypothetical protein [uncultured Oscillibacter sp.]|uniref:hypothetical protein n=1 Tax=uncultured Oscillibacter sp. TaxID=876091 RepID=UPI0026043B68|nr:hypothetical protein [uncultured Oscillibacter sp.]